MTDCRFAIATVRSQADLAAIARLFETYAASLGIDLAYQDFATELATLPGKYAPPSGEMLLARDREGEPLGCVAVRPIAADGCGEIKRLYVVPRGRGLGLGMALIDAVVAEATKIGYRELRLDTLPDMTEAIGLYLKAGFEPIEPYYDSAVAGTKFFGRTLRVHSQEVPSLGNSAMFGTLVPDLNMMSDAPEHGPAAAGSSSPARHREP